jgi:2-polyprenyl-3-methyl-5-hydroxy-6-metoxy-1,4-benzoquinol methylase
MTAVDANHDSIQIAQSKPNRKNIEFIHSTAEDLVLQGRVFDHVCALEVVSLY